MKKNVCEKKIVVKKMVKSFCVLFLWTNILFGLVWSGEPNTQTLAYILLDFCSLFLFLGEGIFSEKLLSNTSKKCAIENK